jgi:hypothetical protein
MLLEDKLSHKDEVTDKHCGTPSELIGKIGSRNVRYQGTDGVNSKDDARGGTSAIRPFGSANAFNRGERYFPPRETEIPLVLGHTVDTSHNSTYARNIFSRILLNTLTEGSVPSNPESPEPEERKNKLQHNVDVISYNPQQQVTSKIKTFRMAGQVHGLTPGSTSRAA